MDLPLLHLTTARAWRAWLAEHHATSRGVWLISFKQHTGQPRIAYNDAVEEALCFGWIDSLVKRLDDERAAQKFTPRRKGSGWSPSNVARFAKLVKEGRMTAAGLVHRPVAKTKLKAVDNKAAGAAIPAAIARALKASGTAWKTLQAMTPAQRGLYVRWIDAAKRPATRERRIRDAIARLERGEKLGLK